MYDLAMPLVKFVLSGGGRLRIQGGEGQQAHNDNSAIIGSHVQCLKGKWLSGLGIAAMSPCNFPGPLNNGYPAI